MIMKRISTLSVLVLAAFAITSCSGLKKMEKNHDLVDYVVIPEVLEAHANMVDVTINGTYPAKYFKKKVTLTATPVLTYASGETGFNKVQVLQGEKVLDNNKVISYDGGNFSYKDAIPYKDAMRVSELMLNVTASKGKKSRDFEPIKLADGVIATSTLVANSVNPTIDEDNFQRIIPESQSADIQYLINSAAIRNSELSSDEIAQLLNYISSVNDNPRQEVTSTVVSSYASPDGKLDYNTKLADNRSTNAEKYVRESMSSVIDNLQAQTTAEDWEGFQEAVNASSIEDKALILRVLSMYNDPEVREREIRNMSLAFESLKTDILPQLRRSQIIVNVNNIGKSDEEILVAARNNFSDLNIEEMLYAATLTYDLAEQLKFYQAAAAAHPNDFRSINNAGCVQLEMGNADDALASFNKARAISNNDIVKNNTGYAYILKGDYAKAAEQFNSMSAATENSKYGLGVVAIADGKYGEAVNNFGTTRDGNAALARLLNNDISGAKSVLDNISTPTAQESYLKAIIGARQNNTTYMYDNLRVATAADREYKALAATDREFAKFWNESAFKAIVE